MFFDFAVFGLYDATSALVDHPGGKEVTKRDVRPESRTLPEIADVSATVCGSAVALACDVLHECVQSNNVHSSFSLLWSWTTVIAGYGISYWGSGLSLG